MAAGPGDATLEDRLELVVGWLPGSPRGSLTDGARSLMPALLYADGVVVVCPMSDNALEMDDYCELRDALPGAVDFRALDSGYALMDQQGQPVTDEDGNYVFGPLDPDVWRDLAGQYTAQAREALSAGGRGEAIDALAHLFALENFSFDPATTIADELTLADDALVRAARERSWAGRSQLMADCLLRVTARLATQPGRYALVDDPAGALHGAAGAEPAQRGDRWTRARGTEVALSVAVLRRRLPTPLPTEPWDSVADVRSRLQAPLRRFRAAMATIATAAESHPLDEDFDGYVEHVWRTRIAPALDELDELAREASLRSVFFEDVLGDLKTYAGPVLGLWTAASDTVPALMSASLAAAPPALSTFAHLRAKRRTLRKHDFLFVREAMRGLSSS